ncbi:N-acetylglutamate synthase-like GNAT family acetyltransferase [Flavobacterium sp. HSC-32F16]|uniref:GNAT family N-acetyltransferase n=1 Tax=Flavobacterium sp. HSC-32F16 TaxID=2910964 RepID=UPI0020A45646|nr:GNAT family N-acetyltransferase [Flavobacterium sp. HSC-32F16]MCP2028086.1 N-acetylglutamate synthase-like GNAT family acetyltransferase [Flavobacterium sp. HSC-32F16]
MTIEKAKITDNEILTLITKKSKAYWGYSAEQIQKWDKNLTISQDYIRENNVFKLVDNDLILGYYSYVFKDEKVIELDNLFILPEHIGKGFGKQLLLDFLNRIKETGIEKITLDSEPNAEEFYAKMGFVKIGEFETAIKKRFMPIMEMKFIN